MEYDITMERTQRFAVQFTAENDEEARHIAEEIFKSKNPDDFDGGDVEYDYAVSALDGREIEPWSN